MNQLEQAVTQLDIVHAVIDERHRQDARFGEQNHPDIPPHPMRSDVLRAEAEANFAKQRCALDVCDATVNWHHILDEEVKEAFEQAYRNRPDNLRAELIQVAAVAVAWIECIDRRSNK